MPHAITISPDLELAARMDQGEIAREVALHLFALGKLSMGKAAEVAEMGYCDFLLLAASRGLGPHYGLDEFREDLRTLGELAP
ncbi:MAG: UPF0175 family protein [Candidatus Riflebacteria bacterium]|nr:UPF0175 family protein [Candidatus Riflebacteria bacterium]